MAGIVIATLIVGVIGLLIGAALVAAGKKFYVEVDEREALVRECLPGNNCGCCGDCKGRGRGECLPCLQPGGC